MYLNVMEGRFLNASLGIFRKAGITCSSLVNFGGRAFSPGCQHEPSRYGRHVSPQVKAQLGLTLCLIRPQQLVEGTKTYALDMEKRFTDLDSKRLPCRSGDGACVRITRTRNTYRRSLLHSNVILFQRLVSALLMWLISPIRLAGPIPSALGRLTSLEILSLGDNKLSGEHDLRLLELPWLRVCPVRSAVYIPSYTRAGY